MGREDREGGLLTGCLRPPAPSRFEPLRAFGLNPLTLAPPFGAFGERPDVSQLADLVVVLGIAVAAVWLPGAVIIQAVNLWRPRRSRAPRSVYIAGPMQDL